MYSYFPLLSDGANRVSAGALDVNPVRGVVVEIKVARIIDVEGILCPRPVSAALITEAKIRYFITSSSRQKDKATI